MQDINQLGCSLHISEKAAKVFSEMCKDEKKDTKESYLRVGAHSGGCSGWKYILDYDNEVNSTDLLFEEHGIKMVVEEYILTDILGDIEVDYRDGNLVEQGFIFKRLKYEHTCGCGESFTPVKDIRE